MKPRDSLDAGAQAGIARHSFCEVHHQEVFSEIEAVLGANGAGASGTGLDLVTLGQRLKDRNLLGGAGGWPYLNSLQDAGPSAASIAYYLDILKEKQTLERVITACTNAISRAFSEPAEVQDIVAGLQREVHEIATPNPTGLPPIIDTRSARRAVAPAPRSGAPLGELRPSGVQRRVHARPQNASRSRGNRPASAFPGPDAGPTPQHSCSRAGAREPDSATARCPP